MSKSCSEEPDQMPRSVASDLGLHCWPMSKNGTLCTNRSTVDVHTPAVRMLFLHFV